MCEAKRSVVILYEHALLGEGIARYLRTKGGVEAMVTSARDLDAVTSALAFGPTVVIFERSEPLRQVDLTALAPHAVLIDVSTVVTRGPSVTAETNGLEGILRAVVGSVSAIPQPDQLSLPAESCLGGTLAAPAR